MDSSLSKIGLKNNVSPFAAQTYRNSKEDLNLNPIEKLCKVDEVVDDLNELYECLKPSYYGSKTKKDDAIDESKLS